MERTLINTFKYEDQTTYELYSHDDGYSIDIIDSENNKTSEFYNIENMQDIADMLNKNIKVNGY